ncbi:MAG: hypothetical protein RJQ09_11990 [Cyclobacteriaceae bacterium]
MAKGLSILLSLLVTSAVAQELPIIDSNLSEEASNKSRVKAEFSSDYDQLLSYTRSSYWSPEQVYVIYGHDEQGWKRLKWILKLDKKKNVVKSKIRKIPYDANALDELLDFFDAKQFWTLQQDSLNLKRLTLSDGSGLAWDKSDGTTDTFEMISYEQHRLTSSYEADYYQDKVPVEQRRRFIECRNKFWLLNPLK